jgi:oxygen-independent coproporphyrinogen-3 oxidase
MDAYLRAICTHIKETGPLAPGYRVDTIYFGGGTPTHFGASGLAAILTTIRASFEVNPRAEITFEANPESVTKKLLRRLKSEGFNRVSLGIQCDNDEILKKLGRPHNYAQAEAAYKRIRRKRYKNVSIDLMYGLPGQSLGDWIKTLEHVLELMPEHVSCYGLKVEEGTPLYDYQEFCNLADDDTQADMYLSAVEILRQHGYRQYEISNFCRKGNVSRHNLKYWNGDPYLGFGPNASSDFGGSRFTIIRNLQGYIDGIRTGGQVLQEMQEVGSRDRAGEYLMMRLRTVAGIDPKVYEKQYLLPFAPLEQHLEQCRQRGLAVKTYDGRWHLTP